MRLHPRPLVPASIRLLLAALLTVILLPASVTRADDAKEGLQRVSASSVSHRDIVSSGPLTTIAIGVEGSVQIAHSGDAALEYYPSTVTPGDAGTLLAVGTTLFAPDFNNHGTTATSGLGTFTAFTPVSQTAVTGSGSAANPFVVVTVYDASGSGLRITETDSYVIGQESYRTDVQVTNNGASTQQAILYRAGDCFLGGTDFGFGVVDANTNAPSCAQNANNTPPGRIEQILPITGGNQYQESGFASIWSTIAAKVALFNSCQCTFNIDNGIGISWSITIAPGASVTRSHLTTFSTAGTLPLTTLKTADSASSTGGAQNGYTITISNPNNVAVAVGSIVDTLPTGFTYVNNSSTGATTQNPSIASQVLTWTGPLNVAAAGNITLHFNVIVSQTAGTYVNNATAVATGFTVGPTGDTAPITVTAGATLGGRNFTLTTHSNPLRVELDWTGGSLQDHYNLLKVALGGQITSQQLPGNQTSFFDTDVQAGPIYCYALQMVNAQGQAIGNTDAECAWLQIVFPGPNITVP